MIKELDIVALAKPVPEHNLVPGDVGTVVMVHEDGAGYTVEFMTFTGETIAVATLDADAVRPRGGREVAHVREVV